MKPCLVCGHRPPKCRSIDRHVLSRQAYVSCIHEGGRGGYGIATHDVLIYHDRALRLGAMSPALRALVRAAVKQEPCGDPAYGGDLHRRALETNAATRRWLKEKEGEK